MQGLFWYCIVPYIVLSILWAAFSKAQRKFLFWQSDAKCENCGSDWYKGHMLEAHHKVPLSDGGSNSVDNGEMLCRPCHADKHESLSHVAKKSGNTRSERNNAYAARSIRKRRNKRNGY